MGKQLWAVVKRPGEAPEMVPFSEANTLDKLRALVGGYIQRIPHSPRLGKSIVTCYCNEEGKLEGLGVNVFWPESEDVIVGPVVAVKLVHYSDDGGLDEATARRVCDFLAARSIAIAAPQELKKG